MLEGPGCRRYPHSPGVSFILSFTDGFEIPRNKGPHLQGGGCPSPPYHELESFGHDLLKHDYAVYDINYTYLKKVNTILYY